MADTSFTHTETVESSLVADSCHVHGTIFDWLFFRTETVYYMQHCILGGSIPDML